MSVVWRGYDELLGREVAVKVLSPERAEDQSLRNHIRHEAMACAKVSHPNVVSVHDYGEVTDANGNATPYVVMDLLTGASLAERLAAGPLPWRDALTICAEVAAAVAAAHELGVVHRDVTPANVLLSPTGAKLVDFGISTMLGERESNQVVLGTAAYLSPERLTGGPAVPATDVYALGVLLYQSLTGGLPWSARTAAQMLVEHRDVAPAPLPSIAGLPPEIAELYVRCLDKRPDRRPGSTEVATRLARAIGLRVAVMTQLDAVQPTTAECVPPTNAGPVGPTTEQRAQPASAGRAQRTIASPAQRTIASPAQRTIAGSAQPSGEPAARPEEPKAVTKILLSPTAPMGRTVPVRRLLPAGAIAMLVAALLGVAVGAVTWRGEATDGARTVVAPQPSRSPTASTGPLSCSVQYRLASVWEVGFTADITVSHTGDSQVSGWVLAFELPSSQRVVQGWNGSFSQTGAQVSVRDAGYNAQLTPERPVSLGFTGSYRDRHPAPTRFALNGVRCVSSVR
jgi:serine/threonine-protein kinase